MEVHLYNNTSISNQKGLDFTKTNLRLFKVIKQVLQVLLTRLVNIHTWNDKKFRGITIWRINFYPHFLITFKQDFEVFAGIFHEIVQNEFAAIYGCAHAETSPRLLSIPDYL